MRHKKDMYIDYNRAFKKRNKNGKSKLGLIILIVLLIIGLSAGVVYMLQIMNQSEKQFADENQDNQGGEKEEDLGTAGNISPNPLNEITLVPTQAPKITQIPATPTPAVIPQEEDDNQEEIADTRSPVKVKGVYITAPVAGSYLLDSLIKLADTSEINAMVIDVKDDHGKISYHMNSPMAKEIGATTNMISDMETLVRALKAKNIYLIARIVAFKDPYLAEQRQELAVKNKDGSIYRDNNNEGWVNPYNTKVWDYLIEVASEAAAVGFDEIQFDYIRFSTGKGMSNVDFGEAAKSKTKEEIINDFCVFACDKLKPLGVYVSADVYGTIISSSIDAGLVGQNYVEMAKYLDYICPMIYPSHFGEGNYGIKYPDQEPYNTINKVMKASKTKLDQIPEGEHRAIVRPWLQDFTATWIKHYIEYGGPELREQIKAIYDNGYEEWLLWNAACVYSEDGLLPQTE